MHNVKNKIHKEQLSPSEKIAFFSIILFLFSITLLNFYIQEPRIESQEPLLNMKYLVEIEVLGAVENPGKYLVEKGTELTDVLLKAKPTINAKVSDKIRNSKAKKSRKLIIQNGKIRSKALKDN